MCHVMFFQDCQRGSVHVGLATKQMKEGEIRGAGAGNGELHSQFFLLRWTRLLPPFSLINRNNNRPQ